MPYYYICGLEASVECGPLSEHSTHCDYSHRYDNMAFLFSSVLHLLFEITFL